MLRLPSLLKLRSFMSNATRRSPLIAIIGATGTGKSQLAVEIAKRYNGEIINGDAMQLYAGLPIITNKIPEPEREGIPHHLLDCIGLKEQTWVVGTFVRNALEVIEGIRSRGHLPILVGGTHYYTQSLLFHDRLAEGSEQRDRPEFVPDTAVKWPILQESTERLLEELQKVDPVMANRWHPNDRRKIQRSLEIYLQTGQKASDIYAQQRQSRQITSNEPDGIDVQPKMRFDTLLFWVHAENTALQARLDQRVDKMLAEGLLDEVESLNAFADLESSQGNVIDETSGIWVSIGYKEFRKYANALGDDTVGEKDLSKLKAEALERTKISTRQYAKRQIRWIRIKLVNALAETQTNDRLFLLDGSDVALFSKTVVTPALDITERFLDGKELPSPVSLGASAAEMLEAKREYDLSATPDNWVKHYCEVCNVTCVTAEQWRMHTTSKSHRKLKRKQQDAETDQA